MVSKQGKILLYSLIAVVAIAVVSAYMVNNYLTLQQPEEKGVVKDVEDHQGKKETKEHGQEESLEPTVEFSLVTVLTDEGFAYIGKGGEIDGVKNPTLRVKVGDVVRIVVTKGDTDGIQHDIYIEGVDMHVEEHLKNKGDKIEMVFKAEKVGQYKYYCTVPGHREAGMEGLLVVEA